MPGRPAEGEGPPRDVEIQGDYAYIANERGLLILRIADPANPTCVGHYYFPGAMADVSSFEVAVSGGYAFIPNQHRLEVIDVSDPKAPSTAAVLETSW